MPANLTETTQFPEEYLISLREKLNGASSREAVVGLLVPPNQTQDRVYVFPLSGADRGKKLPNDPVMSEKHDAVFSNGQLLSQARLTEGMYGTVGGGVKQHQEDPYQAIEREATEELLQLLTEHKVVGNVEEFQEVFGRLVIESISTKWPLQVLQLLVGSNIEHRGVFNLSSYIIRLTENQFNLLVQHNLITPWDLVDPTMIRPYLNEMSRLKE